jgi:multidrug efflux pump subunit AcrB
LGFSPQGLASALRNQNVLQPGGNARVGTERIVIEPTGEFKSLQDIKRVSLRSPGSAESVYLEDLATVRRDFIDPPSTISHFNGERCIMIAVSMSEEGKVTEMCKRVVQRVEALQRELPVGLDYHVFFSQDVYVDRSINDFMVNLLEAFFFVVIVMLIFTGLRMGLIAGALVPMAMLMSMAFMPLFNISLQQISIAALIISLGMLVDNGVVTSEDILVRLGAGQERFKAATGAVRELWLPLLSASLTTICAFLPIAIAKSDVAEFCLSLFQVVSITLLCSWFLALTLVPMLCYRFLKPKREKQTFNGRMYVAYRHLLISSLKMRYVFTVIIVAAFFVSSSGFKFVPKLFFPPNEREMLLVDMWQPYGTDIRVTEERVSRLEAYLLSRTNDVKEVGTFVGSGGPRWYLALEIEQDNPNYANLIINTTSIEGTPAFAEHLRNYLKREFPDSRCTVKLLEQGPPVGAPVQIMLSGPDMDTIYELRDQLIGTMADIPGIVNIREDWGEWTKKLEVDVNQEQAKRAGFTSEDVALSLQAQISGIEVTEYREGEETIPVIIRSQSAYREDLGKIESINIYSYMSGQSIPLLQLARTRLEWQPSNIRRRDRVRTMTIKADVEGRFASEVLAELQPAVAALQEEWPMGYDVEFGGENAESAEAEASIMAGLPTAMGLLVLILIAQFNSFRRPLIIGLTLPLMMIGIVPGLLLTNAPFGFMAFLGMISLLGIIVNNAIMMIDRIEIERAAGQTLEDAIVVAAQKRFRPIIMTATTTIVGLVPLSLQGGEMWRPMANTIIFGLAFATVLTLIMCPVLYSFFFGAVFKKYEWNPEVLAKSDD